MDGAPGFVEKGVGVGKAIWVYGGEPCLYDWMGFLLAQETGGTFEHHECSWGWLRQGHWRSFSFRHAWDVRSGIGCQYLPELGDAVGLVCLEAGVLVEVFPAQAQCCELERI